MSARFSGSVAQEWEHKSIPKAQSLRDPIAINQALRAWPQVQTVKKYDGGSNKHAPATADYDRKLDEAVEQAALNRVAPEVRQLIQKARIDKKPSQADLAKQINERPQVVREYENGKAVWNPAVLAQEYENGKAKDINQALRAGAQVQTVKKFDGGSNKHAPATADYDRKFDEVVELAALNCVAPKAWQPIQKARIDKKLSQADLAKQINERPRAVQSYEISKVLEFQVNGRLAFEALEKSRLGNKYPQVNGRSAFEAFEAFGALEKSRLGNKYPQVNGRLAFEELEKSRLGNKYPNLRT